MTLSQVERDQLSGVIREILINDPSIILDALKEAKEHLQDRQRKIDAIIDEDFKQYEDVFKALA